MKSFFAKIKKRIEDNEGDKIDFTDEEKLSAEEEQAIKEEWISENKKELHSTLIVGGTMLTILIVFCSLIFIFRKSIMKKFNKLTDELIEIGEKTIKDQDSSIPKEENQSNYASNSSQENSSKEDKINCKTFFNGTYSKTSNNQTETLTLASDGSYSRVYSNNSTSIGTYTITNNKIILKEELFTGTSSNNIAYSLSSDCRKITNTQDTTNILKIE